MYLDGINLVEKIENYIRKDYWSPFLGVARSALAFGLLLTLLFNDNSTLFTHGLMNEITPEFFYFQKMNLYNLLGNFSIGRILSVLILLIVLSGIYPRYTCILHWWVSFSFVNASFSVDGGDQINSILTLFLIPICITDKRSNHWNIKKIAIPENYLSNIVSFFFILIIQIQVAFIYFQACIAKFKVDEWSNGTAVYYWFTHNVHGMADTLYPIALPLLKNPIFISYTTWGVLAFEFFLFSCIFINNSKIRRLAWGLGIIFHFGIIIVHGLVSFFFSMLGALTLYLMVGEKHQIKTHSFHKKEV